MLNWLHTHLSGQPVARAAPLRRGFALDWVLSDDARQVYLGQQQIEWLRACGANLVRVDFRLGHYPRWDDTILGQYEHVVAQLNDAGVGVLGLAGHGIVAQPQQAQWIANNAEIAGGDGHNSFIDAYVAALQTLAARFKDRVMAWEVWNEPNVWTHQAQQGNATAYSGRSYIYPSNDAVLLARAYTTIKSSAGSSNVAVLMGGLFGHSNGGPHPDRSGAPYLRDVYNAGRRGPARWHEIYRASGGYPLDGVGQHPYIDQGDVCSSDHIRSYFQWLHGALEECEGGNNPKPIYVTEVGWSTSTVAPEVQAANLYTLFDTAARTSYVAAVLWYELQDNRAANTYYGVIDPSGKRKLSFDAFAKLSGADAR